MGSELHLPDGEIHVWYARLRADQQLDEHEARLSRAELGRAGSFRFVRDRRQFVFARGTLRMLLAGYLGKAAPALSIGEGRFGKPRLEEEPALEFNVSHSADAAMFAFSRSAAVGVDVERHRQDVAFAALARLACTAQELAMWQAIDPALRAAAFHDLWVAKEAVLKALGVGLSVPPAEATLPSGAAGEGAVVRRPGGSPVRLHLFRVPAWPGFSAAVACQAAGDRPRIVRREISSDPEPGTSRQPESAWRS